MSPYIFPVLQELHWLPDPFCAHIKMLGFTLKPTGVLKTASSATNLLAIEITREGLFQMPPQAKVHLVSTGEKGLLSSDAASMEFPPQEAYLASSLQYFHKQVKTEIYSRAVNLLP